MTAPQRQGASLRTRGRAPARAKARKVKRRPASRQEPSATDRAGQVRFRILSDLEIETEKPPEALIEGVLPAGGLCVLYGPASCGKSFVALDWAGSVATGRPWQGCAVTRGRVLYVLAEGRGSFGKRVRAWKHQHGAEKGQAVGVDFIPEPVDFRNAGDVDLLCARIHELAKTPRLIFVDTLARCFGGGDENSAKDSGEFIRGVDRVRMHTGATVVVVHHTGKEKNSERGSSALRGAADTSVSITSSGSVLTLKCEKQKDQEPFTNIWVRLRQVTLEDGESSCVVEDVDGSDVLGSRDLSANECGALAAIRRFGEAGGQFGQWRGAAGLPNATFARVCKKLVSIGVVAKSGRLYVVSPTFSGEASQALTKVSGQSHESAGEKSHQSHPPRRVRHETPVRTIDPRLLDD